MILKLMRKHCFAGVDTCASTRAIVSSHDSTGNAQYRNVQGVCIGLGRDASSHSPCTAGRVRLVSQVLYSHQIHAEGRAVDGGLKSGVSLKAARSDEDAPYTGKRHDWSRRDKEDSESDSDFCQVVQQESQRMGNHSLIGGHPPTSAASDK